MDGKVKILFGWNTLGYPIVIRCYNGSGNKEKGMKLNECERGTEINKEN